MTSFQKLGYATLGTLFTASQAMAADGRTLFGVDKAGGLNPGVTGTGESAIMAVIRSFLQFVTIIAVAYVLWAGFQILTAGGDDDKVKSGRKTIIQVIIGIVVMWIGYALVTWVINALVNG